MKQYLNDYYYELNKLNVLIEQENSDQNKIDSYNFIFFQEQQLLYNTAVVLSLVYSILQNQTA